VVKSEIKLKQNNLIHRNKTLFCVCFVSVLFQFSFRCNHCVSKTLPVLVTVVKLLRALLLLHGV